MEIPTSLSAIATSFILDLSSSSKPVLVRFVYLAKILRNDVPITSAPSRVLDDTNAIHDAIFSYSTPAARVLPPTLCIANPISSAPVAVASPKYAITSAARSIGMPKLFTVAVKISLARANSKFAILAY